MKEYRFDQKENPLPLAVIKNSFKLYFQEAVKLLLMEGIFEILAQNGFHQPENQLPLARIKDLLKNKFTLDGKGFN